MKNNNKNGFTLVELIIVVAIIAVLASLAFMALSGETAQARDSKRFSDIKVFEDSVSTSNGKNKPINYTSDSFGNDHLSDERDDPQTDTLETNAGFLQAIRGAYLLPMADGIFDSDVLPTASVDPKGSYYFGAFISNTDYNFYGTAENPETKISTAIVKGSFKEGAILDVLMDNLNGTSETVEVANPTRFIRGDIIKIDDEYMVVKEYVTTSSNSQLIVTRGYDPTGNNGLDSSSIKVHNKSASIKLIDSADGGESLVCLGTLAEATAGTVIGDSPGTNTDEDSQNFVAGFTLGAASGSEVGKVCDQGDPVLNDGQIVPYKIS